MEEDLKLKLLTFLEALEQRVIVIPAIQRDYAQGRATTQAENIRKAFVQKLDSVARDRDPNQTLNLDLVYMAKDKANKDNWIPVDGQQRLTTLFLFHLYHLKDASELTKFRYEVRLSSQAFCKKVVEKRPTWLKALKKYASPSKAIHAQTWFRSAWDRDPTVTGMIKTLDEIHEVAQAAKSDLFPNWKEKITFWCYETPEDANEEYRKLNARGKPLTPFENLKAYIDGKKVSGWANKIDADWLDTIWALYVGDANPAIPCDTALLSVTLALLLAHHAVTAKKKGEEKEETPEPAKTLAPHVQTVFNVLRGEKAALPDSERDRLCPDKDDSWKQFLVDGFTRVANTEGTIKDTINWMTAPWDKEKKEDFPLADKLAQRKKLTYSDLALLYAYLIKPEKHDDWKRVIHNIVENATIDSAETFVRAVRAFRKLSEGDLQQALKKATKKDTEEATEEVIFAQKQCEEEADKLSLIAENNAWRKPIEEAEKLLWQKGRITFLLDQSKNDNNTHDLETFESVLGDFEKKFGSRRDETWLRQVIANVEAAKCDSVWIPCHMVENNDHLKAFLYWNDAQTKAATTDSKADTNQSIWLQNLNTAKKDWQKDNHIGTYDYGPGVYLYKGEKSIRSSYRIDAAVLWWYELKAALGNRLKLTNGWTTCEKGSRVQAKYDNYEVALLEGGIQLKVGENERVPKEPGEKVPEEIRNDSKALCEWLEKFVSKYKPAAGPEAGK